MADFAHKEGCEARPIEEQIADAREAMNKAGEDARAAALLGKTAAESNALGAWEMASATFTKARARLGQTVCTCAKISA